MNVNKIKAYIGFAIRSGDIIYGVDNIRTKKSDLVIISDSIAESSKNKCLQASIKYNGVFKEVSDKTIIEILNNENIKAFGIRNKELAKAIIENF